MKCVVVLPTYNEAPNIEQILDAVRANGPEWHALVVDDNSPDGTGQLVGRLAGEEGSRVAVLHRTGKLGLGTAYREGLTRALEGDYEYICTMDSDFSHDPALLPRLRDLAERHGAAHGSRYVAGGGTEDWGLVRKANSWIANVLTRLMFKLKLRDCTSGFRCYRRDVLERIQPATLRERGYAVLEEMLYRCARVGVTPAEHPILFRNRAAGESKINLGESLRGLALLFRLQCSGWKPEPAETPTSNAKREATDANL